MSEALTALAHTIAAAVVDLPPSEAWARIGLLVTARWLGPGVYGPVCRLAWEERKRLRREVLSGRNALDALHLSPMPTIVTDREDDGRWIGEVPILPGVLAYGATEAEARRNVLALAFHVIGDRIAHGEPVPDGARDLFAAA